MVENHSTDLTEHEAELYDRQIRLWGLDSQKRIRSSRILICGLNGLGAEIAKNIILAGVKSVKLLDDKCVTANDLCAQFLTPHDSVGKNRASSSVQRAQALNHMVEVSSDEDSVATKSDEFFKEFDAVFVTERSTDELVRIDNACREGNVAFFCGDVWGMFGFSFTDLQQHTFTEDVSKYKSVTKPNHKTEFILVTTPTKQTLSFGPISTVFKKTHSPEEERKMMKRKGPAFFILRALQAFRDQNKRDPCIATKQEDMKAIEKLWNGITKENGSDCPSFVHVFGQLSATAAIMGGVVAQEVIKALSLKEAPHHNLFLFDPEKNCGFIESITE